MRRGRSKYFESGITIFIVNRWSERNPGSTFRRRTKLFMSRPAPIKSTKEMATSAVTSILRRRLPLPPVAASRPPSFNVSLCLKRNAWIAGAKPKITPVASETKTVKPRTLRSIEMSRACRMSSGMKVFNRTNPV